MHRPAVVNRTDMFATTTTWCKGAQIRNQIAAGFPAGACVLATFSSRPDLQPQSSAIASNNIYAPVLLNQLMSQLQ